MSELTKLNKVEVDDYTKVKMVSSPRFSPNGKNACFVTSKANMENNNYESYIYAIKGEGEPYKLTGLGKEASFQFIDDDNILFGGNRDFDAKKPFEGTKLYKINLNGGEAELFMEFPFPAYHFEFLKNGDALFLAGVDKKYPDLYLQDKDYIEKYKKDMEENSDYEVLEETPWWFNGDTFTKGGRTGLFYFEKETKKIIRITEPRLNVGSYYLSKNQDMVIFNGFESEGFVDIFSSNLYQLNLKNKQYKMFLDKKELSINEYEVINDEYILSIASKNETGLNTDGDIYKINFDGSYELVKKFAKAIGSSVGTDIRRGGGLFSKVVNDDYFMINTEFDKAILNKYNIKTNKISNVLDQEGSIDCFDVYNNKVLLVAFFDMKPSELYSYDLKKKELKQITHFNDEYVKEHYISKPERFDFESVKDTIHGFVLKPFDYDEKKKYPVILDIHGGPKTVYGEVYYHEMQYWCSEGYFVIYCNPTGSDGRGRKFADIRGKYGTIDYEDIMNFCDEALKRYPQMDKTNFFETGGSYGGFMTNWIIGHTDRFKACCAQRSISNWFSFYGVSDIGPGFANDQTAADPWDNTNKMWWHSPLKYVPNVKTPTLFIHSNEDYRCPVDQGLQMFNALLTHHVDTKLVYFKGENHDLSRTGKPKHRLKRLNEITEWFKKYLSEEYKK